MKVCIFGGGIAGLSAAYFLSKKHHSVTILEKDKCGGLAATFQLENTYLEKFYHHFFRTDTDLISMIEDLGIGSLVKWYNSKVGFYINNKVYDFSTPIDILKFKPLSFFDRFKLGLAMLYLSSKKDWEKLDEIEISRWHKKFFCANVYEKVWKPLLKLKFSDNYNNISMAWLWGRVHARAKSRDGLYEKLGYLDGSSQSLFDALIKYLKNNNVKIMENTPLEKISIYGKAIKSVRFDGKEHEFDLYISTIPLQLLKKLLPEALDKKVNISYQGMVVLIAKSTKSFTDKYWLNISDESVPFGGVIEQTNLVGAERYNGFHIAYFLNYLPQDHKYFNYDDEQLFEEYFPYIRKISPHIFRDDIKEYFVFKTKFASPVYDKGFLNKMPSTFTNYKNLLISTTANIYPEDRNLSNGVKISKMVSDQF